ncbi:sigma-70 family RNA polymerase sigma factor [Kitasatospora sp. NPDC048540]|uniref:sigma-70 family RNA polymerase sigma factor n=1 Tax=unclassified Kitasatospora TaxID=2633591 RepID=UPI00053B8485|nr:sigma-70 family RNA polymerase sigma factor [Kitasatospora sp. MBT63]
MAIDVTAHLKDTLPTTGPTGGATAARPDTTPDTTPGTAPTADALGAAHAPRRATLDQQTLAELYRLHGGYLLRAMLRATNGDRGKAEDIVQETLLRAWQNPDAIRRGPEHSRPWLFTVARRIAIDHFRMQSARPQEVAGETPEGHAGAHDPYEEVLDARDMAVVLAELSPRHRDVLVELHMKDRSMAEAAAVLGVPVGTVKSRSFYAVRALRPILEARGLASADH